MKPRKIPRKIPKSFWFSVLIIGLMVFSTLGVIFFGFSSENERINYNGFVFLKTQQGWKTTINNKELYFRNVPLQLESINVSRDILNRLDVIEIDVTSDFNSTLNQGIASVVFDMNQKLRLRNIYVRDGFTTNTTYSKPIIKCEDYSDAVPVILIQKSENMSIEFENCIVIDARIGDDLSTLTERIVYYLLGVME